MKLDLVKEGGFVPSDKEMLELYKALGEQRFVHNRYSRLTRAAKDSDSDIDRITAVQDSLIVSNQLTPDEQTMIAETMLWIQHVTIGIARNAGWSDAQISDPQQRSSAAYWSFVTQAIIVHTPWVLTYFQQYDALTQTLSSGQIDVADILTTVITLMLGDEAAQKMAALAKMLAQTQDVGVENVATFFWNSKTFKDTESSWTIGPVVRDDNGNCETAYAYTYMSYTQKDWRSLFVQSHYELFDLKVSGLGIRFYMSSWLSVKAQVEARLQQWISSQIESAPLG